MTRKKEVIRCLDCLHAAEPHDGVSRCRLLGIGKVSRAKRLCGHYVPKETKDERGNRNGWISPTEWANQSH